MSDERLAFTATAALGTEPALRDELRALGMKEVRAGRGSVAFAGTVEDGMRACLELRTAMRVLWRLAQVPAADQDALYEGVRTINWLDHVTPRHTIAVEANGGNEALRHSGFVALKVKDAIADTLRDRVGARPNVDAKNPDVPVVVHIRGPQAQVYLDLAGQALHRRGYRPADVEAPLKETLAAALVLLSGYRGTEPFCDPMAGSGTIAVEAALIALGRAPGLGRHFAFERWPSFAGAQQSSWHRLVHRAREAVRTQAPDILARDWLDRPMRTLQESVIRAGVSGAVRVERGDVRRLALPPGPGLVVSNPPYAERIGKDLQVRGLYRSLGEVSKTWTGWRVSLFSGHLGFEREFGRNATRRVRLFNGALPATLFAFDPQ
ncbi:MAG: RNA methyltransferase [Deltaproteobacteria bacterium]|nr:RNA methyltransferase [Deltaproteobacteria bacterium]